MNHGSVDQDPDLTLTDPHYESDVDKLSTDLREGICLL